MNLPTINAQVCRYPSKLNHDIFEAAVLKKSLVKLLPEEKLLPIILEEGTRIATEKTVVKAQVNIVIQVSRVVDL